MDYYVSDKTTIGVGVNGIIKSGKKTSDVSSVLSSPLGVVDSTIVARNIEKDDFSNLVSTSITATISMKKEKLTADLDYLNYRNTTDQTFNNFVYQPNNILAARCLGRLFARRHQYLFVQDRLCDTA
jgi:hemolysin activation/secretion protein